MSRRSLYIILSLVLLSLALWLGWQRFAAPTRVALVNFPNFQAAAIATSSPHRFIRVAEVPLDQLRRLPRFDAVLVFGMGIRIDADQRAQLRRVADGQTPIFTLSATNPDNDIHNQDSVLRATVVQYMRYGATANFASMLAFMRRELDGKRLFAPPYDGPVVIPDSYLYHVSEGVRFETLEEFELYRAQRGIAKPGAKRIAMVGGFSGGRNRDHIVSMIQRFEDEGHNVYPIAGHTQRMEFLRAIRPDALIYMPHGRLSPRGDEAVEWLRAMNIPMFAPLTVMQTQAQWESDPMGMSGGFLSQSIVMPELDGAIAPYAVNAQQINPQGLHLFQAVPERLETFVRIVNGYLALRELDNSDKRIAIYYFKGPGQGSLTAAGLEVVPSLYNLLQALCQAGYHVEGLPRTLQEFTGMIMSQGVVLAPYAQGAYQEFLRTGNPERVAVDDYRSWVTKTLPDSLYQDVVASYGPPPGPYMAIREGEREYIAVARVRFGNVVLLPQPMAGLGDDAFALVHGANMAPPHSYIASYLWMQHGFQAHAVIHFGTHGSLEFTPGKPVALSHSDWPDRLVGHVPHFYYYTINNVGEGVIAKRRAYAGLITYLTPPFMEGDMRGQLREFSDRMRAWFTLEGEAKRQQALRVKELAVAMGLHRDLRLDEDLSTPYSDADMHRLDGFAEELATANITGQLYTTGVPYRAELIASTVVAMSADPIAFSIAALDRHRGRIAPSELENRRTFNARYLEPAQRLVRDVLEGRRAVGLPLLGQLTGLDPKTLAAALAWGEQQRRPTAPPMPTGAQPQGHPGHPQGQPQAPVALAEPDDRAMFEAIGRVHATLNSIHVHREALLASPQAELSALLNALNGGYISPSPGGDPVANPNTLPTGRNLFSINAEATPSETAWDIGVGLARATIAEFKARNAGRYPRKVTYTLWGGEFIQTEGATLAQALYMLGVEPVRDAMGRINEIRLIPSAQLGRPRIDVLAQTSGQLRDIAASRLLLIHRAVALAAAAPDDVHPNFVSQGVVEAERIMVSQGIPPAAARQLAAVRVFGGLNGMYGTGIMRLVESGDRWESEAEIANTYLNNMGAMYGTEEDWGDFRQGVLRAVLHNADAVVQPRQSNTWGPLSLDHVYEFMGGMSLTIRHVTGQAPDAFFSDYRNRHSPRVQEAKEAIGVEARTTVLNPAYIRERMRGQGSSAEHFAEIFRNTFGFNVMKPDAVDDALWDAYYQVYVRDTLNLNVHEFFRRESPAALQEMTAVMMEAARKGYWEATPEQLAGVAALHTELVSEFRAACSGFVCDNARLREFIAQRAPQELAARYNQMVEAALTARTVDPRQGVVMRREDITPDRTDATATLSRVVVLAMAIAGIAGILLLIRRRRRSA